MLSREREALNKKICGDAMKRAREERGMIQKEVADRLGLKLFTTLSQIERGRITLPPDLWAPVADLFGFDRSEWVIRLLDALEPGIYKALFGKTPRRVVIEHLSKLHSK